MIPILIYMLLLLTSPTQAHAELDRNGVSITGLDLVHEQGDTVHRYTTALAYGESITIEFKVNTESLELTINKGDLAAVLQCGIIVDSAADKCVRFYQNPWAHYDSWDDTKEI